MIKNFRSVVPRRQQPQQILLSALRFVFLYYSIFVIVIGVAVVRSNIENYDGSRDHHRVWYPSDAAKETTDICRYWPHFKKTNNEYTKVTFMNKDLKSENLFRGFNPKIQMVQAMSLSAESQGNRDLILIYDIFFAGDDLVLVVTRYHDLNPTNDISVKVLVDKNDGNNTSSIMMDLPISEVTASQEPFSRDPNQVIIIKFRSDSLSSLLMKKRSSLSLSQQQYNNNSATTIECRVTAKSSKKTFHISVDSFYVPPVNDDNSKTLSLVTVTMIGYSTSIMEMTTWLRYNLRIGFDHIFFYALFPITCLTDEEVDALNSLAEATNFAFSLIQWHPYWIDSTHIVLSVFQDLLYRLKGTPNNNGVDVWISSMDVDEYMVVHPRYPSASAMVKNLQPKCGSLSFANSFFSLVPRAAVVRQQQQVPPSNLSDWHHLALPSNFTLEELEDGFIVYESDLEEHYYRPKNLFLTRVVALEGGHGVAKFHPSFHVCWSGSFFLHYGENSRDRGIYTMKKPQVVSLKKLLTLPRHETNPIFKWDRGSFQG